MRPGHWLAVAVAVALLAGVRAEVMQFDVEDGMDDAVFELTAEEEEIATLLDEATAAMENKQSKTAIAAVDKAIQLGSDDAVVLKAEWSLYGAEGVPRDVAAAAGTLSEAAERGHPRAQTLYGILLSLGEGVARDEALATLQLFFAAEAGSIEASAVLGYRHRFGIGVPRNCEAAAKYYRQASEAVVESILDSGLEPDIEAKSVRADAFVADGKAQSDDELIAFHRYSAKQGSTHSQLVLGQLHWRGGHGVEINTPLAREYLQQAAAAGNGDAMATMGHVEVDAAQSAESEAAAAGNYSAAIDWYNKGVARGAASAMNGLGFLHLRGEGTPTDEAQARTLFLAAAEKGNPDAQLNLGTMFFNGFGVKQNYGKALQYFTMAAHQGLTQPTHYLALMHANGLGTVVSCPLAASLFKTVAERGIGGEGMAAAYAAYESGDREGALLRYRILAEAGIELAQANAAHLLLGSDGETKAATAAGRAATAAAAAAAATASATSAGASGGVATANEIAIKLLAQSAAQGNTASHLQLGDLLYEDPARLPEAVRQYVAAAERSHPQALWTLGYLHQHGLGLPVDLHLAKRYFDLALESSPDAALPVMLSLAWLWLHGTASAALASTGMPLAQLAVVVLSAILVVLGALRIFVYR